MARELTAGMRAVVFDFFGTLTPVSPRQTWAGNAASLAAAMGVPVADLVEVLEETFPDRITGAYGGVAETLQALASRLGVTLTDNQLARATRIRRERQEAMFGLRPEALGVIGALRDRGLPIGLVSDCTIELPEAWSRAAPGAAGGRAALLLPGRHAQARPAAVPQGRGRPADGARRVPLRGRRRRR